MSQTQRRVVSGAMVLVVVTLAGAWLQARQAAPPPSDDAVLAALLTEVRGLRVAMEQMASAGPRVQLFASRLQLQETRINNMTRRLEGVRDNLDAAQRELAREQERQREMESAVAENRASNAESARELAKQADLMLPQIKRALVSQKQIVDRLAAEEAQLTQDISTEQGRWTEINSRLDELERLLTKR
jgi:chromosome segregation ATPase